MDTLFGLFHNFIGLYLSIALILSLGVTKGRSQDNFYFDPAPINQEVVEGGEVLLRCDVSNRNHITFYWTLDDKKLQNTSRRFQIDSNLKILRVNREDDGGSFRCIATNVTTGVSIRSSPDARLDILWMAKEAEVELRSPKQSSEIQEGMDVVLKCSAEGNPEPEVDWFKNTERIFQNERIKFHKNRLKITGVLADDNGVFSCRARNDGGEVDSRKKFLLNVPKAGGARLVEDTFSITQLVKQGDRALLNCQYQGVLLTEWYFDETQIEEDSSGRINIYDNGTLVITSVRDEDEGPYKCVGISESGVQTFVSYLQLPYLDPLTSKSFEPPPRQEGHPLVVPINGKIDVRCLPPQGYPAPTQRWEDPHGMDIVSTGRVKVLDGILSITNAQPQDTGNYTCIVSNIGGSQKGNIWIVVSVVPKIETPPLSTRVQEGNDAEFSCKIDASPYPVTRITWKREDVPIDPHNTNKLITDQAAGTLTIKNVQLADEGNYNCAVNTTGHPVVMSRFGHLYVTKKLKFRPKPVNTKLELGSKAKIHCKAEGQSTPTTTWMKDGKLELPEHVTDVGGTLQFNVVTFEDAGYYMCIARSDQGKINATIQVEVVVKPRFKIKPRNTTAAEGKPVMIHCVATGDPTPTVNWDKGGDSNIVDLDRFELLTNGSLLIKEAYMEDIGKYACTAGNSGGLTREEIYLNVIGPNSIGDGKTGAHADSFNMMKTIIIAVCSAVAYLAIVIGLTVYCSIRLVKAKNRKANGKMDNGNGTAVDDKAGENGAVPTEHTELMDKKDRDSSVVKVMMSDDARSHISGVSSQQSHSSHPSSQMSSHPSSQNSRNRNYDKLAFPRHDLQTLGILGKGHYGDVFLGRAHNIKEGESETLVVVKSLLTRDDHYSLYMFKHEIDMFSKVSHPNVVKLLGLCREMEPHFMISEYCEWGDLKQYLLATRTDNGKRNIKLAPLTMAQKVSMCYQVAQGMECLSNNRLIHKDLAARNILLSPTLDLKISNLCLCRDVYQMEYFLFHQKLIPLRWMPTEAVLEEEYSSKSDVWSYSCFIYEVFSLGDLPLKHLSNEDVLRNKSTGEHTLQLPMGIATLNPSYKVIYDIFNRAHANAASQRINFNEISELLGELLLDSNV